LEGPCPSEDLVAVPLRSHPFAVQEIRRRMRAHEMIAVRVFAYVGGFMRVRRCATAIAVFGCAVAVPVGVRGSTAAAVGSWGFVRVQGADRYATAAAIARTAFPSTASSVVVASGVSFPDALASSYLAGVLDGPILLTDPLELPSVTSAELIALGATQVYVVGGTSAVSAQVEAQIGALTVAGVHPKVSRLSGATRYATAQAIAEFPTSGGVGIVDGARTAFLASGTVLPDALAASPVADAAGLPIMLTDPATLSPQVAASITDDHVQHVVILGGTSAVGAAVESAVRTLGVSTQRVAGADRTLTAAAVAAWAIGHAGFATTGVALARGDQAGGGVDALSLSVLAAHRRDPLLLTASPTDPGPGTAGWFADNGSMLTGGVAAGGPSALADRTLSGLAGVAGKAGPASTGTVWAWGFNGDGELGNGTNPFDGSVHIPGRVANLSHVAMVVGGGENAYALHTDGTVSKWGLDTGGPSPGAAALAINNTPVPVQGLSGITGLAASYNAGFALDSAGTVWAWGSGALGQVQTTPGYPHSELPLRVLGLPRITAIGAGWDDGYAIAADGTVWDWRAWGGAPVQISALTGIKAIAGGASVRFALRSDGTVWTFSGDPAHFADPATQIGGLTNVTSIATGQATGYALRSDGTVWAWGSNEGAALGDGTGDNGSTTTPVQLPTLTGITQIASFGATAYAKKSDGTVWAWGSYYAGALGNGTDAYTYPGTTGADVPVQVTGLSGVTSIGSASATGYAIIGQ
jgi:putative cell wall-binding protein/alpha-tubulin suppressor-like RCC1 family protein